VGVIDDDRDGRCLRIAAAGDLHCREDHAASIAAAIGELQALGVDIVLLCGDLTAHGLPSEAAVLADACRGLDVPVVAVLGNHDWHAGRRAEVIGELEEGGVTVLERSHAILELCGVEVGIAGVKGFVGGYSRGHLPDFGEPALREVYRETTREVEGLERALRSIEPCPVRIVVMHYSPIEATIEGEPVGIWPFLGSDRLAAPIAEHEPDLVLHGHAHAGRFAGAISQVPVYNVSVPVIERDFWVFELSVDRGRTRIH